MMAGVGQDNERTLAVMSDVNREIFVDPPPKKVPTKESFLCCFAEDYQEHYPTLFRITIGAQIFLSMLTLGAVLTADEFAAEDANTTCLSGEVPDSKFSLPEIIVLCYAVACGVTPLFWATGIIVHNLLLGPAAYLYLMLSPDALQQSCIKEASLTVGALLTAQICMSAVYALDFTVWGILLLLEYCILGGDVDDISFASLDIQL